MAEDDHGWGRAFLLRCGIDPDDPADVRAGYESCRTSHGRWLATGDGDMDAGTYYMLVEAIEDLYGWSDWPLGWLAPTLVLMAEPFRDLIPRAKKTETPMGSEPLASIVTRIVEGDELSGVPTGRAQWAPGGCTCPWPWPLEDGHIRTSCPHYVPPSPPKIAATLDGCHQTDGSWIHGRPHNCPAYLRGAKPNRRRMRP